LNRSAAASVKPAIGEPSGACPRRFRRLAHVALEPMTTGEGPWCQRRWPGLIAIAFPARSRARDRLEAILRFRARTCSAHLFDYQRPRKDSVDMLTWVRRNIAARRAVRVYSSERPDSIHNGVGSLGVRAMPLKPVSAHDLIASLPASTAVS
jgi:hypothetical protein